MEEKRTGSKSRKKLTIIVIATVLVLVVALAGAYFAYPSYAMKAMDKAIESYNKETISYDIALEKLEKFSSASNSDIAATAKKKIYDLDYIKSSHESYYRGIKKLEQEEYNGAYENLSKVKEQDNYYSTAQQLMQDNLEAYKEAVYSIVDTLEADQNYSKAIDELNAYKTFSNDAEVTERIESLQKKKEKQDRDIELKKMAELKKEQLVTVTKAYAYNSGLYYVNMDARIILKNLSDKVAKKIRITILQFDDNGYPVDTKYSILGFGQENYFEVIYNSANILPGSSAGENHYWDLDDSATKIKACVKEVEFIDGTKWENKYHNYWLKEEKDMY